MTSTTRYERIEHPTITVPLRDDNGRVHMIEVYREDHLDPGPDRPDVYLILDFADELRLVPINEGQPPEYRRTGGFMLELQAIDRTTGEGLAMPHTRIVDPTVPFDPAAPEVASQTGGRTYSTRPITGLTLLPVSKRRPSDETV